MTTPEEFKEKTKKSLDYLDSILPDGSGVVLTGPGLRRTGRGRSTAS